MPEYSLTPSTTAWRSRLAALMESQTITRLVTTLILIGIYVFFRFNAWQLSVGAIFAAIHDPIIVLGFFAITGIVFDLSHTGWPGAVKAAKIGSTALLISRPPRYPGPSDNPVCPPASA